MDDERRAAVSSPLMSPAAGIVRVMAARGVHSLPRPKRRSGGESAPLGQRHRASLFVNGAGGEMTLLIEVVVKLRVN
jgi:hypothetical protein